MGAKAEAIAHHQRGRYADAEALYRRILDSDPDNPEVLYFLGMLYQQTARPSDALPLLKRAVKAMPRSVAAYTVLGFSLAALGRHDDAQTACEKAVALRPDNAIALNLLGQMHHQRGEWQDAVKTYEKAVRLQPQNAQFHHHLAVTLHYLGRVDDAISHYKEALEITPDDVNVLYNLGLSYRRSNEKIESKKIFESVLRLQPGHMEARYALINSNIQVCQWEKLEEHCRQLEETLDEYLDRNGHEVVSPTILNYLPVSPDLHNRIAAHHADQYKNQAARIANRLHRSDQSHDGIRIGYVSPDFGAHAVGGLIHKMFEHHSRPEFRIYAYSLFERQDPYADRIRSGCDVYRDISTFDLLKAAQTIVDDEIDILIDLCGYTEYSRPELFALRPAPVQIAWLGYLNTMSASFIDYLIVDEIVVPQGEEGAYSESLVRLPGSFIVVSSLPCDPKLPSRLSLSLPEDTFVFASFNNSYKIDPEVFDCWMRILERCPGSVLWIYAGNNEETASNLKSSASSRGIDADRLVIAPGVIMEQHLARLPHAGLFLDTFRYNAGATAICSLRVGVPVITRTGDTLLSRMGTSFNCALGLEELNCQDTGIYEDLAVALAQDSGRLSELRSKLLDAVKSTTFLNTAWFVRNLETAFREVWKRREIGNPPADLSVAAASETE